MIPSTLRTCHGTCVDVLWMPLRLRPFSRRGFNRRGDTLLTEHVHVEMRLLCLWVAQLGLF